MDLLAEQMRSEARAALAPMAFLGISRAVVHSIVGFLKAAPRTDREWQLRQVLFCDVWELPVLERQPGLGKARSALQSSGSRVGL